MKFLAVLFSAGLLVGCASVPVKKTFMSWEQYGQVAHITNALKQCFDRKELSVEHAAIGHEILENKLKEFHYDKGYLDVVIRDKQSSPVNISDCNMLAVQYERTRQNRAASARLPSFQMPLPTNTTCRTTFGTTHCTSY